MQLPPQAGVPASVLAFVSGWPRKATVGGSVTDTNIRFRRSTVGRESKMADRNEHMRFPGGTLFHIIPKDSTDTLCGQDSLGAERMQELDDLPVGTHAMYCATCEFLDIDREQVEATEAAYCMPIRKVELLLEIVAAEHAQVAACGITLESVSLGRSCVLIALCRAFPGEEGNIAQGMRNFDAEYTVGLTFEREHNETLVPAGVAVSRALTTMRNRRATEGK